MHRLFGPIAIARTQFNGSEAIAVVVDQNFQGTFNYWLYLLFEEICTFMDTVLMRLYHLDRIICVFASRTVEDVFTKVEQK